MVSRLGDKFREWRYKKIELLSFPTPLTLNFFWCYGSLLIVLLVSQIVTGLFLSMYYDPLWENANDSVFYITRRVKGGWFVRNLHAAGANMMFVAVYIHIGRGIYYGSYDLTLVWLTGIASFFLLMGSAFLGYVLPWGNMSYWAAVVITSMVEILPRGKDIKYWLWGGYAIQRRTLRRFFVLHFVLPFLLGGMVMLHMHFLHQVGSSCPLGCEWNHSAIPFYPYYFSKDLVVIVGGYWVTLLWALYKPWTLYDKHNYEDINLDETPADICPEWFFLAFYTVVRGVPHKTGGILLMFGMVLVLCLPMFTTKYIKYQGMMHYRISEAMFWCWVANFLWMTSLGAMPILNPRVVDYSTKSVACYYAFFVFPLFEVLHDWLDHPKSEYKMRVMPKKPC